MALRDANAIGPKQPSVEAPPPRDDEMPDAAPLQPASLSLSS